MTMRDLHGSVPWPTSPLLPLGTQSKVYIGALVVIYPPPSRYRRLIYSFPTAWILLTNLRRDYRF